MPKKNQIPSDSQLMKAFEASKEKAKVIIEDEGKFEKFAQRLEMKLRTIPKIGEYAGDIGCMLSLANSYVKREYTDIPLGSVISIVGALIYFVSPIDLVPDFIPLIGILDDVAVIGIVIQLVHSDMEEYRYWRQINGKELL